MVQLEKILETFELYLVRDNHQEEKYKPVDW